MGAPLKAKIQYEYSPFFLRKESILLVGQQKYRPNHPRVYSKMTYALHIYLSD